MCRMGAGGRPLQYQGVEVEPAIKRQPRHGLLVLPLATVYYGVIQYLCPRDLAALSYTCSSLGGVATVSDYWQTRCQSTLEICDLVRYSGLELARATALRARALLAVDECSSSDDALEHNLIVAALGCSSQDQVDECPSNTITPSPCLCEMSRCRSSSANDLLKLQSAYAPPVSSALSHLSMVASVRCQTRCGCAADRPCYWSSSATRTTDTVDHLTFQLRKGTNVVTRFAIAPYRAFWQPDSPTYAPVHARIAFYHESLGEEPYYVSPKFAVQLTMELQNFTLPKPAIFMCDGAARVELLGKQTHQTLGPAAGAAHDAYYTCLSFVGVYGASLAADVRYEAAERWLARNVAVTVRPGAVGALAAPLRFQMFESSSFEALFAAYARRVARLSACNHASRQQQRRAPPPQQRFAEGYGGGSIGGGGSISFGGGSIGGGSSSGGGSSALDDAAAAVRASLRFSCGADGRALAADETPAQRCPRAVHLDITAVALLP